MGEHHYRDIGQTPLGRDLLEALHAGIRCYLRTFRYHGDLRPGVRQLLYGEGVLQGRVQVLRGGEQLLDACEVSGHHGGARLASQQSRRQLEEHNIRRRLGLRALWDDLCWRGLHEARDGGRVDADDRRDNGGRLEGRPLEEVAGEDFEASRRAHHRGAHGRSDIAHALVAPHRETRHRLRHRGGGQRQQRAAQEYTQHDHRGRRPGALLAGTHRHGRQWRRMNGRLCLTCAAGQARKETNTGSVTR
mmetsp:Transcript_16237/g.36676  ORF Transcript_16237/g.36676 Transcript_16237/m.36676 type:complete len:247 (+) Transcript_16237:966-1706(+)